MTDQKPANGDDRQYDDLELITSYLNKRLDPERVAQVARRLEEDPEFRELAAPMLLVWRLPTHLERHPRPPGELERDWDRFTREAGFVHQRRKARRRRLWIFAISALVLGLSSFVLRGRIAATYADLRYFETVPADTGWITLPNGSEVRLAKGARLRASRRLEEGVQYVKLNGEARFKVVPRDTNELGGGIQPFGVNTRAGRAFTGRGEFTVTTRGDTTEVEVHHPSTRFFMGFFALPTSVLVSTDVESDPISIGEGRRARLVKGQRSQRLANEQNP